MPVLSGIRAALEQVLRPCLLRSNLSHSIAAVGPFPVSRWSRSPCSWRIEAHDPCGAALVDRARAASRSHVHGLDCIGARSLWRVAHSGPGRTATLHISNVALPWCLPTDPGAHRTK